MSKKLRAHPSDPDKVKKEPAVIAELFNGIAQRYDATNRLLSLGLNAHWSRLLTRRIASCSPHSFADLCGGTGEITARLLRRHKPSKSVIIDFSAGMLEIARARLEGVETIEADVCHIPVAARSFDAAAMAYGIRNIQDREKALQEAMRILKPGGTFFILELTRPKNPLLRLGHYLHIKTLVPLLGKLTTRKGSAYRYLSDSIEEFIDPSALKMELVKAGFISTVAIPLTGGIATLLQARKP